MITIYSHPIVQKVIDYYGSSLYKYDHNITIKDRLSRLAQRLWEAVLNDMDVILNEINNYHPAFINQSWSSIRKNGFNEEEAFTTIARQYGYSNWSEVPEDYLDVAFERTIDCMLAGQIEELEKKIRQDASLLTRQSSYAHRASLIHYAGSNGVELYRQVLPSNLPEILTFIIEAGANIHATMKVYGGNFELIELLKSSVHPYDSGLYDSLIKAYEDSSKNK